jgi:hypothetical protein
MARLIQIGNRRKILAEGPVLIPVNTDLPLYLEIHREIGRTSYALELDPHDLAVLAQRAAALAREQQEQQP